MARDEKCILTNMCMVCDGERVLVQNRIDPDWSGIVFPGGHVEPGESFVASVIREVKEETGLDISNVQLCGVKQFPCVEADCRYIVFLFKTNTWSGELKSSAEGEVFWLEREKLKECELVEGFEGMYEVFQDDSLTENYHWIEEGEWKTENR